MQLDEDAMGTEPFPGGSPLYVLTNSFNTYGASVMFNTEAMDQIAYRFGDGYFVIPSSVHELLVIPREEGFEPDMFNTMISEVNENEVSEEEILSYLKEQVPGLILVDSEKAAAELGSSKCLNVVLLGAAARSGALGLAEEELLAAIRERLPAKLHELNARALRYRSM